MVHIQDCLLSWIITCLDNGHALSYSSHSSTQDSIRFNYIYVCIIRYVIMIRNADSPQFYGANDFYT